MEKIKFLIPDPMAPLEVEAVPTGDITGSVKTKSVRVVRLNSFRFSYSGSVKAGIANGYGEIWKKGNIYFKGTFKKGRPTGRGTIYFSDGSVEYVGNFKDGKFNGKGKRYTFSRRQHYIVQSGSYSNGKFVKGTLYENGKEHYSGAFKNGLMHGRGTLYGITADGTPYVKIRGIFKNNHADGAIDMYSPRGQLLFHGVYRNNERVKGSDYDYFAKTIYTGTFKNDRRDGVGKEVHMETGALVRKGIWKNGSFESGTTKQADQRKLVVLESKIKKYIQSSDRSALKGISTKEIQAYLKKYARKDISGSRSNVIKELNKFRQQLHRQRSVSVQGPAVFDAYQGIEVPLDTFLGEDDRVLFVSANNTYYGSYLEQCQILYECQANRSFRNYIGKSDVRSILQFPSASGPKFYFDKSINDDLLAGYNVFHFKTEPQNIRVLSKDVARGGSIVSALHCDPKDVIKISRVTKKEKMTNGLKKTITFDF
jgi:antitoxin component YwqK of YwqJK toxin-antitoxin module